MTTTAYRVSGDTNDTVTVACGGVEALPVGATVEAHVWRTISPASTTTLAATVLDPDARTVLVKLGSWITAAASVVWRLEVQVTGTWSDGETGPRTFPSQDGIQLPLRAAGG